MNSTSHTGAAGELLVSAFFLSHGLEVFRNVASSGPADIVLQNKDKFLAVDVKSVRCPYTRKDGTYSLPKVPQFTAEGIAIVVYVHGEAVPRLPEGFWEALGMETSNEYS